MDLLIKPKLLKGVSYEENRRIKKYKAKIRIEGKLKHLGYFRTEQEAHEAYLNAKEGLNKLQ